MDETAYWYVDELSGIAIQHSDAPNLRVTPFLYAPSFKLDTAKAVTIAWPVLNINAGDAAYKDYLNGFTEQFHHRSARLSMLFDTPEEFFQAAVAEHK